MILRPSIEDVTQRGPNQLPFIVDNEVEASKAYGCSGSPFDVVVGLLEPKIV